MRRGTSLLPTFCATKKAAALPCNQAAAAHRVRPAPRRGGFVAVPVAASGPGTWDDGVVHYYDASGIGATVSTAAQRWNDSGARVQLIEVGAPDEADVIFEVDDKRLRAACGHDCLGYTSSIGAALRGARPRAHRRRPERRPAPAQRVGRGARVRPRARPAPPRRPRLLADERARLRHELLAVAGRRPADGRSAGVRARAGRRRGRRRAVRRRAHAARRAAAAEPTSAASTSSACTTPIRRSAKPASQ